MWGGEGEYEGVLGAPREVEWLITGRHAPVSTLSGWKQRWTEGRTDVDWSQERDT